jgi:hypothetical protein
MNESPEHTEQDDNARLHPLNRKFQQEQQTWFMERPDSSRQYEHAANKRPQKMASWLEAQRRKEQPELAKRVSNKLEMAEQRRFQKQELTGRTKEEQRRSRYQQQWDSDEQCGPLRDA